MRHFIGGTVKFEERIRELVEGMPDLEELMRPLLSLWNKLRTEFAHLHKKVLASAEGIRSASA